MLVSKALGYAKASRALRVVGVDLVPERILIELVDRETELVLAAPLVAARVLPVVLVRGVRQSNELEEGVRGVAHTGFEHRARPGRGKLHAAQASAFEAYAPSSAFSGAEPTGSGGTVS